MNPQLRVEIERILREESGDGISHGAVFRLQEEGLTTKQIAAERGVQVGSTQVFVRSLKHLFAGTLPTSKSGAADNSYGYRELLNHSISPALAAYVDARLRELQAINPAVSLEPLNGRAYQYGQGPRKNKPREIPDNEYCPDCKEIGIFHTGECPEK
jgi:hypothetical protein